jgi:excisionase family DNA binding protein
MARENPYEFLTPRELSEYMKVSMTTVYRLVDGRHIAVYRIGKRLRFKKSDVDKYVESQLYSPVVVRQAVSRGELDGKARAISAMPTALFSQVLEIGSSGVPHLAASARYEASLFGVRKRARCESPRKNALRMYSPTSSAPFRKVAATLARIQAAASSTRGSSTTAASMCWDPGWATWDRDALVSRTPRFELSRRPDNSVGATIDGMRRVAAGVRNAVLFRSTSIASPKRIKNCTALAWRSGNRTHARGVPRCAVR